MMGVTVRIGLERSRIDDTFIKDQGVRFGARDDMDVFGGGISGEVVWIGDRNAASGVERLLNVIENVLF